MVDLLNPSLRVRDLRKLVELKLHEVTWDPGVDETSEWVVASQEDALHTERLFAWLVSKGVDEKCKALRTDSAWSDVSAVQWAQIVTEPESFFCQKHVLIIAADRSWVIEYAPQDIVRFGRWLHVT